MYIPEASVRNTKIIEPFILESWTKNVFFKCYNGLFAKIYYLYIKSNNN